VALVAKSFAGVYAKRNKALFVVGVRTGFCIGDLLSLRVADVAKDGNMFGAVTVQRRHMKGDKAGKTSGRMVLCSCVQGADGHPKAISRVQARNILIEAYAANGLEGQLGTHAMRKTFANRIYEKLGHALVKTQRALGHANINSTVSYLSFREADIDAAILAA
jgi:integrase